MTNLINFQQEIWKSCSVIGFPNYIVSNMGRVKNIKFDLILTTNTSNTGYKIVCLYNNYYRTVFPVARLVLSVFTPVTEMNIPRLLDADHINGNKEDNRLENLRWLSHRMNCNRNLEALHAPRGKQHRNGFFVCYDDGKIEYYRKQKDAPFGLQELHLLLRTGKYSKKYHCKVFYQEDLPDEYQAKLDISDKIF